MSTRRAITLTAPAAVAAAVTCALVALLAAPAQAAAYRYWTYWQSAPGDPTWAFSNQGAGTTVPPDGAIEAWSFAISTESAARDAAPGMAPDFAAICSGTQSTEGSKRVALVIDPGPAGIAPEGEEPFEPVTECVVADVDATGYEIMRSVVQVRTDNGLVCALDGYPATECAPILDDAQVAALTSSVEVPVVDEGTAGAAAPSVPATAGEGVSTAAGEQQPSSDSQGTPLATLAVVALLGVGAVVLLLVRRRRS